MSTKTYKSVNQLVHLKRKSGWKNGVMTTAIMYPKTALPQCANAKVIPAPQFQTMSIRKRKLWSVNPQIHLDTFPECQNGVMIIVTGQQNIAQILIAPARKKIIFTHKSNLHAPHKINIFLFIAINMDWYSFDVFWWLNILIQEAISDKNSS